jgi:hypothetical protein
MAMGERAIVARKSEHMDDWYVIEWAEHDGREWLENDPDGYGSSFMTSARISDADVEGTASEMLAIADAIEKRDSFSAKRCMVAVRGVDAIFMSPRNSLHAGVVSLAVADALAAQIRRDVKAATE